jgi:O-acetyl-ADP-ribose deacetylase (regulator of RNase III)
MGITYTDGDLLTSPETVIAHGCNLQGVMGSGIARSVAISFPNVYEQYRKACENGSFVLGSAQPIWDGRYDERRCVVNLGTQDNTGKDATVWGIFLSFANLAQWADKNGVKRIGIPRIGAGIGGLRWDRDVLPAIEEALERATRPIDIVVYDLQPFKERHA